MALGRLGKKEIADGLAGSYFISLHTGTSPSDGNEVTAADYARQSFSLARQATVDNVINSVAAEWTASSSTWGTVRSFRIVSHVSDDQDESGNAAFEIIDGTVSTLTINTGDTVRIANNAFTITFS